MFTITNYLGNVMFYLRCKLLLYRSGALSDNLNVNRLMLSIILVCNFNTCFATYIIFYL